MRRISRDVVGVYWLSAVILSFLVTFAYYEISEDSIRDRIAENTGSLSTVVQSYAAHSKQVFSTVEVLAQAVSRHMAKTGDPASVKRLVETYAEGLPALQSISVFDYFGNLVVAGGLGWHGEPLRPNSTTLRHLSGGMGTGIKIGPVEQHDGGGYFLDFVYGGGSRADGYYSVVVKVNMDILFGFYEILSDETGDILMLVGDDDYIRAASDTKYTNVRFGELFGTVDTPQIVITKPIAPFPLVVAGVRTQTGLDHKLSEQRFFSIAIPLLLLAGTVIGDGLLKKYLRKRYEVFKEKTDREIQQKEKEFLGNIIEDSTALIAVINESGRVVVLNKQFRELITPVQSFKHVNNFLRFLGFAERDGSQFPIMEIASVIDPRGKTRHISWTIARLINGDGNVGHYVAFGFDLTDLKERESALHQSEKLVTLGEMATGLAHEINQPLGAMTLAVENLRSRLQRGTWTTGFFDESLVLIAQQLDRVSTIIKHMRVFGRRTDGAYEPTSVKTVIDGALLFVRHQFEGDAIDIHIDLYDENIQVMANQTLAEQIILNLLMNARDAIVGDSHRTFPASISISTTKSPCKKLVQITVTDDGPGIPENVRHRIFEPFFSTKAIGKGMGLGLSMSYGMAKDMNGDLSYRDLAKGSEFTLILPSY